MATIKSYTSLEQSKKLAEILPPESADMRYAPFGDTHPWCWDGHLLEKGAIPCWSLTALLGILPRGTRLLKSATDDTYHCGCIDKWYDSPIDACYEMILKLKGNDML